MAFLTAGWEGPADGSASRAVLREPAGAGPPSHSTVLVRPPYASEAAVSGGGQIGTVGSGCGPPW